MKWEGGSQNFHNSFPCQVPQVNIEVKVDALHGQQNFGVSLQTPLRLSSVYRFFIEILKWSMFQNLSLTLPNPLDLTPFSSLGCEREQITGLAKKCIQVSHHILWRNQTNVLANGEQTLVFPKCMV